MVSILELTCSYESGVLEGHTKILDDDFACSDDGRFIFNASLTVLERLLRFGVVETNAVEVANLGCLRNQGLDILNGCACGHLDRLGKALDGLLRSCCNCQSRSLYWIEIMGGNPEFVQRLVSFKVIAIFA